jgi:transposase
VQVADRWHLLKNMGDTLKEVLAREYPQIRKALVKANSIASHVPQTGKALAEDPRRTAPAPSNPDGRRSSKSRRSEQRRERRIAKFEEARALRQQGLSYRAIAARVGLYKKTVRKFAMAPAFPEYAYRRGASRPCQLDPYKAYIVECWQRGCHNSAQIWREIVEQGYKGGWTSVKDFARELRLQYQHFDRQDNRDNRNGNCNDNGNQGALSLCLDGHSAVSQTSCGYDLSNLPTANKLRWLMVRPPDELNTTERATVLQVCHASKEVTITYGMVLDFNAIVRERQRGHLNSWISIALSSTVPELERFARGLQKDYRAVAAALELPWSNGQVEGQVNRLKLRKRQLYGRAKFDLLRKYVMEKV